MGLHNIATSALLSQRGRRLKRQDNGSSVSSIFARPVGLVRTWPLTCGSALAKATPTRSLVRAAPWRSRLPMLVFCLCCDKKQKAALRRLMLLFLLLRPVTSAPTIPTIAGSAIVAQVTPLCCRLTTPSLWPLLCEPLAAAPFGREARFRSSVVGCKSP